MVQHLSHIQNLVTPEIWYNIRRFRRLISPLGASGSGFGIFQPPPLKNLSTCQLANLETERVIREWSVAKRIGVGLFFLLLAGFVVTVCVMPHIPRWLWQSKNPDLQEIAIPSLMKQIKVGMRPDEVARLFGETNACLNVQNNGCSCLSYNVNSWYNTGIDIVFTNGIVSSVFEFN